MVSAYIDVLRRFGDAVVEEDYARAVALHEFPFRMERSGSVVVFREPGDVAADLAHLWRSYRASDVRALRPRIDAVHRVSEDEAAIEVEWTFWTGAGRPFCHIRSTYKFRETADGPRLVGRISHDEPMQRPTDTG